MRVSLVVPDFEGGGCERVFCQLASGLLDRGARVEFLVVRATGPNLKRIPAAARVVELAGGSAKAAVWSLARHLRRQPPDAVVSGLNHTNLMTLAARFIARARVPVILTQHGVSSLEAREAGSLNATVTLPILRRAYRFADAIVCVSRAVADDLVAVTGLPPEKVHVIYNPILGPGFAGESRQPAGHPWLDSGREDVVLAVGSLSPVKNFGQLLRTFALVRKDRRARLIILGEGPERKHLEASVRRLGIQEDVALPGFVENPSAWVSRSAAFVLCSLHEALSTVVVEALACGCRVVCTDCPGGVREILDQGRLGLLVPVNDDAALAHAIKQALDGPKPALPPGWLEKFTIPFAARRYAELIAGLPRRAPGRP